MEEFVAALPDSPSALIHSFSPDPTDKSLVMRSRWTQLVSYIYIYSALRNRGVSSEAG